MQFQFNACHLTRKGQLLAANQISDYIFSIVYNLRVLVLSMFSGLSELPGWQYRLSRQPGATTLFQNMLQWSPVHFNYNSSRSQTVIEIGNIKFWLTFQSSQNISAKILINTDRFPALHTKICVNDNLLYQYQVLRIKISSRSLSSMVWSLQSDIFSPWINQFSAILAISEIAPSVKTIAISLWQEGCILKDKSILGWVRILQKSSLERLSSSTLIGKRPLKLRNKYKLLPALKEIVYKVLSFDVFKDYQFVVIFDDLDIGFKSDVDQDKQSLMELIRTAKEFNNDLKEINNTKVIILIRDDIKSIGRIFCWCEVIRNEWKRI